MTHTPETDIPNGLKWSGRRLWQAVAADFELSEHETSLLLQACRTVDLLDALQARLDADGPIVDSPQGLKAHPAAAELRQQRITLARLVASIGLPTGVVEDAKKLRGAARGAYQASVTAP
ncbi:terminase [Mycolicibacterium acapulense]|nr:terminase [Mycolicibacterium acapulense]